MGLKKPLKPTEGELQILIVLWKKGPCTVRDVNQVLADNKEVGYTTTLKLMQIMHEKGLLRRSRQGKSHIYSSVVSEDLTQKQLVEKLLDTAFHGSALKMVMQALGSKKSSPQELKEIKEFIKQLETGKKGGTT
ncbi:MAG: BlaI/MecI/CopY family transcriptional regulator [Bacteroidetes bacterium]|nr:BlaI/MecI/CopY family transcriptional regulator [Bacteroidota bacterium]